MCHTGITAFSLQVICDCGRFNSAFSGDALRSGGVPVTEFRAGMVVGSGSISFEMLRDLSERLPIMICPRWVSTRTQPIAIRDVLDYLRGAAGHPERAGVVEIGGPDVL